MDTFVWYSDITNQFTVLNKHQQYLRTHRYNVIEWSGKRFDRFPKRLLYIDDQTEYIFLENREALMFRIQVFCDFFIDKSKCLIMCNQNGLESLRQVLVVAGNPTNNNGIVVRKVFRTYQVTNICGECHGYHKFTLWYKQYMNQ